MNNYNKLKNSLLGIVYGGSFLVVIVPLIVIPQSYFPYIVLKTIILRVLIEAIFLSWLVLAVYSPEYRVKKGLIFWSVSAFMLVWLMATIFSQSWIKSLWGNYERMGGLFNFIHYYFWWLALANTIKNIKNWYYLLNFSLLVSVIICLYSIGQRIGLSITLESGLERVNGTIGNAAYLASYLLFHIFIAWYFFAKSKALYKKLIYLAVFLLQLFILTLTSTRGAQVAFIIAVGLFAVFSLIFKLYKDKSIRLFIAFSFLMVLIGAGIFIFNDAPFIKNNYYLNRLSNISFGENTVQTRLISWQAGLKGFKDYLLTGVGPENYNIVFNRYFEPDFYLYTGDEVWFDRAHNTYVDMAAMLGLFGLLTYLAIFAAAIGVLWRFYRCQGYAANMVILALMFIAYLIQDFFVFDSLNSYIPLFMMLAFVDFLGRLNSTSQPPAESNGKSNETSTASSPAILTGAAAIFMALLLFINIPQVRANQFTYKAFVAARQFDYKSFVSNYEKAIQTDVIPLDPINLYVQSLVGVTAQNADKLTPEEINKNFQSAINHGKKGIELDPKNVYNYYLLAKLYNGIAEMTKNGAYLDKAIDVLATAKSLSPNMIRVYWVEAQTYIIAGEYDKALADLDYSISLVKSIPEPYWFKSLIYFNQGRDELAYENIALAVNYNYRFTHIEDVKSILPHYEQAEDDIIVEKLYRMLINFEPKNMTYYERLAAVLEKQGRIQEAIDVIMKASQLQPAYSDRAFELYTALKERL